MAVTLGLVFLTVAHKRNGTSSSQRLEQTQSELLPVVLYEAVASIDASTFLQLRPIAPCKITPSDVSLLETMKERFAWPEIGHPYMISALRQASPSNTGDKDTQAILGMLDG